MTIGVISAMDSEHRQLAERLQEKKVADYGNLHYVEGMFGSNRVILTQCGIGKVNAAVGATELIRRFCPGLHCEYRCGGRHRRLPQRVTGCSGERLSGVPRCMVR